MFFCHQKNLSNNGGPKTCFSQTVNKSLNTDNTVASLIITLRVKCLLTWMCYSQYFAPSDINAHIAYSKAKVNCAHLAADLTGAMLSSISGGCFKLLFKKPV